MATHAPLVSRFLTLARLGEADPNAEPDTFTVANAGDTIDEAHRGYINAVAAAGNTDVYVVERVPLVYRDSRTANGRVSALAEKLGWCQERMLAAGLTPEQVKERGGLRFSADAIRSMFSGEEVKSAWVDHLYAAVRAHTRHLDPAPSPAQAPAAAPEGEE